MQENKIYKITGIVDSVMFKNDQNGYIVLDLDIGSEMVTVVGELGNIDEGEELVVMGDYVTHPKFGIQFSAQYCERKLPETAYAIQKYLSSGVVKGIGPTLSKRIVDAFGEASLDIIENNPSRLMEIKGISPKKYEDISIEFQKIFGIRKLMLYLSKFSIPPAIAIKTWKRWGTYSIEMIKENPYCLCNPGIDLDFNRADKMALSFEEPIDDIYRIKAYAGYVLNVNANAGHTCLPTDKLQKNVCDNLDISEEAFCKMLEKEYEEENFVEYMKKNRSYTFLNKYYTAERYIAGRLAVIKDFFKDNLNDYTENIDLEEELHNIKYEKMQRKAIEVALSQGFMILTGGPGTGKTTTLNAIISLFEQQGISVMIAAPTGRAAKRISDLTGYDAKTIHRLLEVGYSSDGEVKFIHNENNPIHCDVLIIDEMSMVDTLLFESLLRAVKLNCRLILVGDCDQLPSVGAGNVLKDIIDSNTVTVVKLTEIFRQARQSGIVMNAHKIVNGENIELSERKGDFYFLQRLEVDSAVETVIDLYKNRLPKAYNISSAEDIQVISPTRKGFLGTVELNKRLQMEINPPSKNKSETKGIIYVFREGDKIMQTRNNYDIIWSKDGEGGSGIFNGDIGYIEEIKKIECTVRINFDGRIAEYGFDMLEQLELAYAITVHKSQGSEFPFVILPLLNGFDKLYYRNLLYTAVTRAKKLLVIVGSKTQIESMISNNRRSLRFSCLKEFIREEIHELENN